MLPFVFITLGCFLKTIKIAEQWFVVVFADVVVIIDVIYSCVLRFKVCLTTYKHLRKRRAARTPS